MSPRLSALLVLSLAAWIGCSSGSSSPANGAPDGGPGGGADGGTTPDGRIGTPDGGSTPDAKNPPGGDSGPLPTSDGGTLRAGNPNGSCTAGLPAGGQPADTSHPTTVVGSGTAASCTFSALEAAVTAGGIVTFNCGSSLATIPVTATLIVPIDKDTVIDGGGKITLDGGGAVQILSMNSPGWQTNESRLTLQHIAIVNAKTTPTQAIPPAPAPCSQGYDDGQGGGLYVRDGNVTIIDSIFANDQAALVGPDTGGGGLYIQGSKHGVLIVGSTFMNNNASNGGGVGCLFAELDVYNSLFTGNVGSGHDANNNDPSMCSVMNNGQNEIGSGGNGGALYNDGASTAQNPVNIVLCGDAIETNAAGMNAFGGGIFFTSNNFGGTLSITDSTITGNTGGHWTNVMTGSVTNAGTAVGTNAKSITIVNSTVQGYP